MTRQGEPQDDLAPPALRIAHGLAEFLTEYLQELNAGPRTLLIEDLHQADPTDRELVAVLLRRMDPALLTLVVSTGAEFSADPEGPVAAPLPPALERYCRAVDHDCAPGPLGDDPAGEFVDGDGTADDPRLLAAYQALAPERRTALHDARRTELEQLGEPSLALGAIAWHAQHGSAPAGRGADALVHALNICMDLGFYHAVVDYAQRGLTLVDHESHFEHWWALTTKMTTSYAALGLPELALPLYNGARAATTSASVHLQAAYATAMLYTRHLDPDQRDHQAARGWINQAIAFAGLVGDTKQRAMQTAFNRNGLALIEVHQKRPQEALLLLDDALARLDEALDPTEHALHRSVLRYNRAQVHASLGRHADALEGYTAVIELDPHYAEYWFDRGMILRRLGRAEEALADYEQAIRLSPPFPEAYYNRADVKAELGDVAGAVADFGYVLELDPEFTDAYLNRAVLLSELDDLDGARRDVEAGLALAADNTELLCLKAQLHSSAGEPEAAAEALTAALLADEDCAEAWALRGVLAYENGDLELAVADLERALSLSQGPGIAFNLAVAQTDAGGFARALELLDGLLAEDGGEDPDTRLQRARCLLGLGRRAEAEAELQACRQADPELAEQVDELLAVRG
ncbi:tetratricopeptide (TPR) repeat protein [Kitasatospora sp. MAA4]|uniref:tetratricopeptide repeat protein n=1 Tax=Kitasatospora sp. MAA4 TaxID=3035093 RepID=UPI002476870C|nr:tetratricopeptide repeat protein [Kitasatospora sp. MAA4]MDH6137187.1 tetratricopeptide (TPR) repeat protein [Kitasatospora sp. MAA4]